MTSYFYQLPDELLFTIISYLDIKEELNNLIYSSEDFIQKFLRDIIWKKMFYQNIEHPEVNEKYLWRDNYYNNMNLEVKYNVKQIDELSCEQFIIIKSEWTDRLLSKIENVKKEVKILGGGDIDGSEQSDENTNLIFITHPEYIITYYPSYTETKSISDNEFIYKNKYFDEFISGLFSRNIADCSGSICIKSYRSRYEEDVIDMLKRLDGPINIYKRITFQFNDIKVSQLFIE